MRDRPNQSVITVPPSGQSGSDSTACPAENTSHFGIKAVITHPVVAPAASIGVSARPRPLSQPAPRGLALQYFAGRPSPAWLHVAVCPAGRAAWPRPGVPRRPCLGLARVSPVSSQKASTADTARGVGGDMGLPWASHARARATAESPRVKRSCSNGSGDPTRNRPRAAARSIRARRVGPSRQRTRHAGRPTRRSPRPERARTAPRPTPSRRPPAAPVPPTRVTKTHPSVTKTNPGPDRPAAATATPSPGSAPRCTLPRAGRAGRWAVRRDAGHAHDASVHDRNLIIPIVPGVIFWGRPCCSARCSPRCC